MTPTKTALDEFPRLNSCDDNAERNYLLKHGETIKQALTANTWRDIKDAPETGVFLVINKHKTVYVAVNTSRDYPAKDIYPFHTYTNQILLCEITHWQPLPEQPPC